MKDAVQRFEQLYKKIVSSTNSNQQIAYRNLAAIGCYFHMKGQKKLGHKLLRNVADAVNFTSLPDTSELVGQEKHCGLYVFIPNEEVCRLFD